MAKDDAPKRSAAPKVILILLLIAAIVAGGAVWYHYAENGTISFSFFGKGKVTEFEAALSEHNYQAAVTVYNESEAHDAEDEALQNHLREYFDLCCSADYSSEKRAAYNGLEILRDKVTDTVLAEMDDIVARCYAGEFASADAKAFVNRIGAFSFTADHRAVCLQWLDGRDAAVKAYDDAVTYYVAHDFPKAVAEFKKIPACDTIRYPLAQEGLQNCHTYYCPGQIAAAEEAIANEKPEEAKKILKNLLKVFENDPEATALLEQIE